MKILQVVSGYPPMIGGVENSVYELVQKLRSQGHDVKVITANMTSRQGEKDVIRLRVLLRLEREWGDLLFCPSILQAIREAKFQIVHTHTPRKLFSEAVTAYKLLSKRKFPYIVSIRLLNTSLTGSTRSIAQIYQKTIEKYMLKNAKFVVVQSMKNKAIMNEVFNIPLDSICIVPNGVDTKLFDPKKYAGKEDITGVKKDAVKSILFVGRLTTQKGLCYLFNALPRIKEKCGDFRLMIIGEGPLKKQLIELSRKLDVANDVVFLGEVKHDIIAEFYSQADVFVMPSLSESFPNVMLEAMAMEKAVVATKVGVVPEVATDKENAILIEPGDEEQIANSVITLFSDASLRKKLGANARKLVEETYTWDSVAKKTLQIYEKALA